MTLQTPNPRNPPALQPWQNQGVKPRPFEATLPRLLEPTLNTSVFPSRFPHKLICPSEVNAPFPAKTGESEAIGPDKYTCRNSLSEFMGGLRGAAGDGTRNPGMFSVQCKGRRWGAQDDRGRATSVRCILDSRGRADFPVPRGQKWRGVFFRDRDMHLTFCRGLSVWRDKYAGTQQSLNLGTWGTLAEYRAKGAHKPAPHLRPLPRGCGRGLRPAPIAGRRHRSRCVSAAGLVFGALHSKEIAVGFPNGPCKYRVI